MIASPMTWIVAATIALGACEGSIGTIRISLVTAPDSAVIDEVVLARLTLSNPPRVVETTRDADGRLILDLDVVADGPSGLVTFEGFNAGNDLVAFGRSGPLPIASIDADVAIYVGSPMTLGEAPIALDPPRSDVGTARLSFGVVVAGGRDASGAALDDLVIYNVYDHELQVGLSLPAPRTAPIVQTASAGFIYLFGGNDIDDDATATLWRFDTNATPAGSYQTLLTDDALARAGVAAAPLGGDEFVVTGDPLVVIDGVGGEASEFPAGMPLAGTATSVVFNGLVHTLIAGDGSGETGAVLLANDAFSPLDAPAQIARQGHGAVILPDGDILVIGGETAGGLIASSVRFDVLTREFDVVPDMLATPRRDAAIAATSRYIVVAGGTDADGSVVTDAEIFDASSLARVTIIPMVTPRAGASAELLSNDQVLIVGGTDAAGAPTGVIELFTPDL